MLVATVNVQTFVVVGLGQTVHPPKVEEPAGVAVSIRGVPLGNAWLAQGPGLEQLKPLGELVIVPDPLPKKVIVNAGFPLPPPEPVKQMTLAVMYPVTSAPDDEIPPELLFVLTVAETRVFPQAPPVAVIKPVELTVTICGVFEFHVASSVMSFVTGGWMYEPRALS